MKEIVRLTAISFFSGMRQGAKGKVTEKAGYHYICGRCGTRLFYEEHDAVYCEECGNKLTEEDVRKNDNASRLENK
ncbi:MAG: hypothetical protein A2X93_07825 [Deltaproteobacteria bacterium GWC2_56_8]|nr:MAG: hypothetical protein A2X93_07825 [Deltaproteobacteria bacterium GWC2_56_8]